MAPSSGHTEGLLPFSLFPVTAISLLRAPSNWTLSEANISHPEEIWEHTSVTCLSVSACCACALWDCKAGMFIVWWIYMDVYVNRMNLTPLSILQPIFVKCYLCVVLWNFIMADLHFGEMCFGFCFCRWSLFTPTDLSVCVWGGYDLLSLWDTTAFCLKKKHLKNVFTKLIKLLTLADVKLLPA